MTVLPTTLTVGGIVQYSASLAQNESLSIQPTGTEEHSIYNIEWSVPSGGNVEIRRYTPDGEFVFSTNAVAGVYPSTGHAIMKVSNGNYIKVKNTGTTTVYVNADGTRTK